METKNYNKKLNELKEQVIADIRKELKKMGFAWTFETPIMIDDHNGEVLLQGVDINPIDNGIILLFEDYQEEGEYVIQHPVEELIFILKSLREQYAKTEYSFVPGYYEYHFINLTGDILLNLNDPSDHCYDSDGNPIEDFQQLKDDMLDVISEIRDVLEAGDEDLNGNTLDMFNQLPEDEIAAEIMARALWNDYIAE